MKHLLSLALIAAAAVITTSSASAQEAVRHHGFQFRYAGGIGYLIDDETSLGAKDGVVEGLTIENSLYFGGFVARGFAIGGAVEDHYLHRPQLSVAGRSISADPSSHLNLASVGPYLDFYPDPKGGLHLTVNGGVAVLRLMSDSVDISSNGMNLGGGVGYDWRARSSSDWNVGLLAKLSYSNVDFTVGRNTSNESVLVKSLMFSVSYH